MAVINFNSFLSPYSAALSGADGFTCTRTDNLELYSTTTALSGPGLHNGTGLLIWHPTSEGQSMFSTTATTDYTVGASSITLFKNASAVNNYTVNANFFGTGRVGQQSDNPAVSSPVLTINGTVSGLTGYSSYWNTGWRVYGGSPTTVFNRDLPRQICFGGLVANGTLTARANLPVGATTTSFPTTLTCAAEGNVPFAVKLESSSVVGAPAVSFGNVTTGSVERTNLNSAQAITFILGGSNTGDNTMLYGTTVAAGTMPFEKQDAGRWILEGDNSALASNFTLKGGTLKAKRSTALGAATPSLTMSTNTTLALGRDTSNNPITISKQISAIGTIANEDGANTLSGAITMTGATAFDVAAASSLTVSNIISGLYEISKTSAGTLNLTSPASSFTGTPTISAGTLAASTLAASGSNSSIGAGSTIAFTGTGVLQYPAASTTGVTLNRSLTFTNTAGAGFENNGGTLALTGTATMNGTNIIVLSGTHGAAAPGFSTLASSLGDGSDTGFNKSGTGRWIVSGNNNLGGTTTVSGGTLMGAGARGASDAKLLGSSVTVQAGGRIQLGSDSGQKGKNRYGSLIVNGASGNPAKVRIGGSAVNPTVQMSGNLVLPTSGQAVFDLSADVFKSPGTYTLIEFSGAGVVTGGIVPANVTSSGLATGRSAAFTYNSGATPKTVTVTIS